MTLDAKALDGINSVLLSRHEEETICVVGNVSISNKKKILPHAVVLGSKRVFVFRLNGKLEYEANFLELLEVTSLEEQELSLKFKSGLTASLLECDKKDVENIILHLYVLFRDVFPERVNLEEEVLSLRFSIQPPERLLAIKTKVPPVCFGACGGFVLTYAIVADLLNCTLLKEIAWDVDNLWPINNVQDFDMTSFRKDTVMETDFKVLLRALHFNAYFTRFFIRDFPLHKDVGAVALADLLRENRTLTDISLPRCSLQREHISVICEGLVDNQHSAITCLDLSGNTIEDKGMFILAGALSQSKSIRLVHLNLNDCGAGKTGTANILTVLAANFCDSLEKLQLSGNSFHAEGSVALAKLFDVAKVLDLAELSNCNLHFESLKNASTASLTSIDISGNNVVTGTKHKTSHFLFTFLWGCKYLNSVNFGRSPGAADLALQVPTSPTTNRLWTIRKLDLADTDLGDEGVHTLCDNLIANTRSLHYLILNRVFAKRSKFRARAISSLTSLVESDVPLIGLEMTGNQKTALKGDLVPFLFGLMTNKTLKSLDISGHAMGDILALIISRVVQTNTTLTSIVWDDNNTTIVGFSHFLGGLQRNCTIINTNVPSIDVSKELAHYQSSPQTLLSIISEIQQIVVKNAAKSDKLTPSEHPLSLSQEKHPLSLSREQLPSTPKSPPPFGMSAPKSPPPLGMKKSPKLPRPIRPTAKKIKSRPPGIDTMSAAKLFAQLSDFVSNAEDLP